MAVLNPGSPEATEAGCRCPVIDNHYGAGFLPGQFVMNADCPIHGIEAHRIIEEIEAREGE